MPDQFLAPVLSGHSVRDAAATWFRTAVAPHYPLRVGPGRHSGCTNQVFTFGYICLVVTE
ncbi:MAG: hypothetical protein C0482_16890 [Gordonia sp.]|nr:hypothetical protein [Gordonia sp. (in: high G+C Gram-positive bacteria)]OZG28719.1 hypothetical protein BH683_013370 [Williamsia sp. 1138]